MMFTWKVLGVQNCLHFIIEWARFERHWYCQLVSSTTVRAETYVLLEELLTCALWP